MSSVGYGLAKKSACPSALSEPSSNAQLSSTGEGYVPGSDRTLRMFVARKLTCSNFSGGSLPTS